MIPRQFRITRSISPYTSHPILSPISNRHNHYHPLHLTHIVPSPYDTPSVAYHPLPFTRHIMMKFHPLCITRHSHHPLHLDRRTPLIKSRYHNYHPIHLTCCTLPSTVTHHPVHITTRIPLDHHELLQFAGYLSNITPHPLHPTRYAPPATCRTPPPKTSIVRYTLHATSHYCSYTSRYTWPATSRYILLGKFPLLRIILNTTRYNNAVTVHRYKLMYVVHAPLKAV